MLDQLPFGSSAHRSSFGKNRFHPDLARFSLDLSRASVGPVNHGLTGSYPSPPMSGSPPVSDLEQAQEERQTQDTPQRASQDGRPEAEGAVEVRRRTPPWELQHNPEWSPVEPAATSARNIESQTPGYHQTLPPVTQLERAEQSSVVSASATTPALRAHAPPLSTRTPRRTKAHVPSACINCRKAHLACDVQRPCARCVTTGKEETCRDVQHKKRGRPRIKDDRGAKHGAVSHIYRTQPQGMPAPALVSSQSPLSSMPHPSAQSVYRTLRAGEPGRGRSRRSRYGSPLPPMVPPTGSSQLGGLEYPGGGPRLGRIPAMAYLRMNFDIVRAGPSFSHTLRYAIPDLERSSLLQIVDRQDLSIVSWLQHEMQREQEIRERAYMPPPYEGGELEAIRHVQEADIPELLHGSTERTVELTFRLGDGQQSRTLVRFALVRTSVYFVVMTFEFQGAPVHHIPEGPFSFSQSDYSRSSFAPSGYGPLAQSPSSSQHAPGSSLFGSYPGAAALHYPPRDFHPSMGPPSVQQSPATSQQSPGAHFAERRPFDVASPPAPPLPGLQSPRSPPSAGGVVERNEQRQARREYPRELQLPPIRSQQEPGRGDEGRRRRRTPEENNQEDDEQDDGRRRKRPRVSVKSMLE